MSVIVAAGDVSIRLLREDPDDIALMARWLSDPRVLEFYGGRDRPLSPDGVRAEYGPQVRGEDAVVPALILQDEGPVGFTQFYRLDDQPPEDRDAYGLDDTAGVWGIDLFIGEPELWGQGVGTRALEALVGHLFRVEGASRVAIDPQVTNERAIRAYEKAGFRKVRVLPGHELHEGERRDCWLMVADR